jgi:hypothetical protein
MSWSIDFHFKAEEGEKIKTRKSSDLGGKPIFIITKEKKSTWQWYQSCRIMIEEVKHLNLLLLIRDNKK